MLTQMNAGKANVIESAPLWENPNTSVAFASGAKVSVPLAESYDNYDMLRFYYYNSTASQSVIMIEDIDPSIFDSAYTYRYVIGNNYGGRNIMYGNSQHTSVDISQCFQLFYNNIDNTQIIPIKITGLKNVLY